MDIHETGVIYHFDRFNICNAHGNLDPIFRVTVLYVVYLLNEQMDFLQPYIDVPLG